MTRINDNLSRRAMLGGAAAAGFCKPGIRATCRPRRRCMSASTSPAASSAGDRSRAARHRTARRRRPTTRAAGSRARRCRCRAARWRGRRRMTDKMHIVGGYGEQRVDRPYHHVYDPATDRWSDARAIAARRQPCRRRRARRQALRHRRLRRAEPQAAQRLLSRLDGATRGGRIAPLPARLRRHRAASRMAACCMPSAAPSAIRSRPRNRSTGIWSTIRRPTTGATRADAPRPRPHRHPGGRRPDPCHRRARRLLPHQFEPASRLRPEGGSLARAQSAADRALGARRRALPRADLHHGRRRHQRVYGQNEAYDPQTDRWESYAPMPTPRHGLGAVASATPSTSPAAARSWAAACRAPCTRRSRWEMQ